MLAMLDRVWSAVVSGAVDTLAEGPCSAGGAIRVIEFKFAFDPAD